MFEYRSSNTFLLWVLTWFGDTPPCLAILVEPTFLFPFCHLLQSASRPTRRSEALLTTRVTTRRLIGRCGSRLLKLGILKLVLFISTYLYRQRRPHPSGFGKCHLRDVWRKSFRRGQSLPSRAVWWNHMVPSLIGNGSTSGGYTCT